VNNYDFIFSLRGTLTLSIKLFWMRLPYFRRRTFLTPWRLRQPFRPKSWWIFTKLNDVQF